MPNPLQANSRHAAIDEWDLSHGEVEVGILIFDIEHREMGDHLKHLYDCIADDKPKRQVRDAMTKLLAVSKKHFDHEEEYMKLLNYADLNGHADDHNALAASLEGFIRDLLGERSAIALDRVRDFFRGWLLDHILEHDRTLANFLAQKGLR